MPESCVAAACMMILDAMMTCLLNTTLLQIVHVTGMDGLQQSPSPDTLCLCREVDLGPFKHKIDDGLELRKAAFECMDVLLERCKDRINMPEFITHLEQGLQVSSCRSASH